MDELMVAADGAAAGVEVIEAAAEHVRQEVLALKELGAHHAELNGQLRLLTAERDAVATEYLARYRELSGGQFLNTALRQLGMAESLGGAIVGKKRRRAAAKKTPSPAAPPS